MTKPNDMQRERRSFLTRFQAGAATVAALAVGSLARAQEKAAPFVAVRHDKDEWLEQNTAKHRMVIDTTATAGFADALLYSNNFLNTNRNEYGLQNKDLALLVIARHTATQLGYNDAMWAKYGASFGGPAPESGAAAAEKKEPPKANPHAASLTALAGQGVQFAVCATATRRIAGRVARDNSANVDTVFAELGANLIANARLVPAGIVALNRAQERGYSAVST